MKRLPDIIKAAVLVAAIIASCAASCSKTDTEVLLSVKAETDAVSAKSGQIFVSVKCNSPWTAFLADDADGSVIGWASLNADSGKGDRNLILSYEANTEESLSRKVRITVNAGGISEYVVVEQAAA